jgi:hypothetical protein|tara:strand:- start:991 stop:1218 length:228 start_codon:yes stop_codon:yes gene_type:complete
MLINFFGDNMKQSKLIAVKLIPNFLPVSLPTVRSWIFQQKLPVVRLGRKVFVREEVLEKIEMEGLESVTAGLNSN